MLIERVQEKAEAIAQIGKRAIEKAHRAGGAAYYMDPRFGEGIIKELPDGTRQKIRYDENWNEIVMETHGEWR